MARAGLGAESMPVLGFEGAGDPEVWKGVVSGGGSWDGFLTRDDISYC